MQSLDKKLEEFREKLIASADKVRIARAKVTNPESDTLTADEKEELIDSAVAVTASMVHLFLDQTFKGTEKLAEAKLELRISEMEKDND